MPEDPRLDALREAQSQRFYGKYRGKVVNNVDPQNRGRLQVIVPEVTGENVPRWALPAVPYAGNGVGFFTLPPLDTSLWVEFEAGNLRYPIWTGCFWGEGEIDAADAVPGVKFLKTGMASIRVDDDAGEVRIEVAGAAITLTASEVKISAATILNEANGGKTQLTAGGFDAQQGAFKVV